MSVNGTKVEQKIGDKQKCHPSQFMCVKLTFPYMNVHSM